MKEANIEKITAGHYQIVGDMTFETVSGLCKKQKHLLKQGEQALIDLSQVGRADSAGIACLLELIRQSRARQVDLRFENIQEQLLTLIRLSGVEKLFVSSKP